MPVILLILLLTLAACTRKADEVHEATLAAVTPGVISPTDELTVTGTGFYETDTAGLKVSVCGVQLQELRFSGEPRFIILPDGTRIEARVGNQLTGRVGEDLDPGFSEVVVTLPDERELISEVPVQCVVPEPEPEPEPEPQPQPEPEIVNFTVTTETPLVDDDVEFVWHISYGGSEELTCRLGDMPVNCEAGRAVTTFSEAGDKEITLTAIAAELSSTATARFQVMELPAAADFAFTLLVNQSLVRDAEQGLLRSASGFPFPEVVAESGETKHGRYTIAADGAFTYTPQADFFGADEFEYTVTNAVGAASGTVSLVVDAPVPVARDDRFSATAAELPFSFHVQQLLANDENPAGGTLTVTEVNPAPEMSWDPLTGLITYDPGAEVKDLPAGEVHTVTFTYQVTAGWGFSSSATVTLDIIGTTQVLSVSIDEEVSRLAPGWSQQLVADVQVAGNLSQDVAWSSSDPDVVTVTADGTITAAGLGSATVTAVSVADSAFSADVLVTVSEPFIMKIDTTLGDDTEPMSFRLKGTGLVTIDWGDGTREQVVDPNVPLHYYDEPGAYTITVVGSLAEGAAFGAVPARYISDEFVRALESWGELGLTSLASAFMYAKNLEAVPDHLPEGVTSLSAMFNGAVSFNQDLNGWDTSRVTDFSSMFWDAQEFNGRIDQWDMSSATSLAGMFSRANSFNQPIGDWNTDKVTNMSLMFSHASSFNQDIGGWNTGKVTDFSRMFSHASSFNQPIGGWDTANAVTMLAMFAETADFNQEIGDWDTSGVETMVMMFVNAGSFNQDIGRWNTSKVTAMELMFLDAQEFDQDLSGWCVQHIPEAPERFSESSGLHADRHPVWGTCP